MGADEGYRVDGARGSSLAEQYAEFFNVSLLHLLHVSSPSTSRQHWQQQPMVGAFVSIASVDKEMNGAALDAVMSVVESAGNVVNISDSPFVVGICVGIAVVFIVEVSVSVFSVVFVVDISSSISVSIEVTFDISVAIEVTVGISVVIEVAVGISAAIEVAIGISLGISEDISVNISVVVDADISVDSAPCSSSVVAFNDASVGL